MARYIAAQTGYLMGELDDRVAVITGAASGIGAAAARLFIGAGARVVMGESRTSLVGVLPTISDLMPSMCIAT